MAVLFWNTNWIWSLKLELEFRVDVSNWELEFMLEARVGILVKVKV